MSRPTFDYPNGPLAPDSLLYVHRPPIEQQAEDNLLQKGSVLRIRGPYGTGKSSLCLRLRQFAQAQGYATVTLDLRTVSSDHLTDSKRFFQCLCRKISRQLKLAVNFDDYWDNDVGSKINFTYYLEDYVLSSIDRPLVMFLQTLDHLFDYPDLAQEFLPLLRSWHEEAKYSDIWQQVRLVLSYSTEISTQKIQTYQSPFNVGLPLRLPDFTPPQVEQLAQHYGLAGADTPIASLMNLLGGQPLLINLAFYHGHQAGSTIADYWPQMITAAATENGIYRDYLRRYWHYLEADPILLTAWEMLLAVESPLQLDPVVAYQLEGLGLITLNGAAATISCELYRQYFQIYWRDRQASQTPTVVSVSPTTVAGVAPKEDEELQKLQQENLTLRQLAKTDPLTQLANRGHFDQKLQEFWQNACAEGFPLALLLCDVDCFKSYNDTFGHVAGDDCLQQVAAVLKQNVSGPFYVAARYGGEEFAVLLPGADLEQGEALAEHLRLRIQALDIAIARDGVTVIGFPDEMLTVSVGVASTIPSTGQILTDLIEAADRALYEAKRGGRNQVCRASEPEFQAKHLISLPGVIR